MLLRSAEKPAKFKINSMLSLIKTMPYIQALCKQTSVSLMEFLDGFAAVRTAVDASYLWRPNLKDEADNHLVELAIAARAAYIIIIE